MYLKQFQEFAQYTDPGSVNQLCRDLLPKGAGEAKDLGIGICNITGPGHVAEDAHATWSQYFVVVRGSGTLYYNGQPRRISQDTIIEVPKNTRHYVKCDAGESISYFFINRFD